MHEQEPIAHDPESPAPPPEDGPPRVTLRRAPMASLLVLAAFFTAGLMVERSPISPFGPGGAVRVAGEAVALPPPVPAEAMAAAEAIVQRNVDGGAFPGAAVAFGRGGGITRVTALGRTMWDPDAPPVSATATRYDLASLTKVVATTAAVMALVEDGRMELDAPVSRYLPEFTGGDRDRVTVRMLLTHTGGIRAGAELPDASPRAVLRHLISLPPVLEPGEDVLYSDVGFVILYAAAERASGQSLPRYLRRRVWRPIGMRATGFAVRTGCRSCAPTLRLDDGEAYAGGSYDETGRRLGGTAGNAGIFSTAADLARFAAMIAGGGMLDGVRVFRPETVAEFTRPQPGAGTRALGWETYCQEGKVPDSAECDEGVLAFGHTGVTGTSLWIDPETRTWVVLLTNRVFEPKTDVDMQMIRRRIFRAATALEPAAADSAAARDTASEEGDTATAGRDTAGRDTAS